MMLAAADTEKSALVGNSTSRPGSSGRKLRSGRKFDWAWLVAAIAVAALVLTGCGAGATPAGSAPTMAPPSDAVPSPESTVSLGPMKKAAGIADCPKSDPDVAAVPSGLPDVVLPCLGGGREVRLAGLRGKPMMINIWAQWCAPCREEAPYLADVATTNKSELMILGIDHADPQPALAIEFAQLSAWKYPQLADPDVVLRAALQITGPPQTFLVRPDGTIAYRHAGSFSSADEIRGLVRQHLGVNP
ncbi:MAG TPA: TlpA disulfide reductase family protein [Propionibacteriaceae bacterium]|nr:TlpA disulfide reductase family protein [Propionibacteriaceae bacterium]